MLEKERPRNEQEPGLVGGEPCDTPPQTRLVRLPARRRVELRGDAVKLPLIFLACGDHV